MVINYINHSYLIWMRTVPGSLPMPTIDRSLTSRTSSHRTLASMQSRRASSAQGCRGISVSASRAGAARAAAILLLSCRTDPYEVSLIADTCFGTGASRPVPTSMLFALYASMYTCMKCLSHNRLVLTRRYIFKYFITINVNEAVAVSFSLIALALTFAQCSMS